MTAKRLLTAAFLILITLCVGYAVIVTLFAPMTSVTILNDTRQTPAR